MASTLQTLTRKDFFKILKNRPAVGVWYRLQPARKKQKHKQLDIRTLFAGARNQRNQGGASSVGKEQGNEIIEID